MTRRFRLAQNLHSEPLVSLYELDVSKYGGGVRYWTAGPVGEASLNAIWNPNLASNSTGWSRFGSSVQFGPARLVAGLSSDYILPNEGNGALNYASIAANGFAWTRWLPSTGELQVAAGQWVHAQAKIVTHRCKARVGIQFWNGVANLGSIVGTFNTLADGPASSLSDYETNWVCAQAPANTTHARLVIWLAPLVDGQPATNPWLFWTHALLAPVPQQQLRALEFGPGAKVGSVSFNGVTYTQVPAHIEGFERTGRGPVPRITLTVPDVDNIATQLLGTYQDLLGCKITRKQVFRSALDDGAYPDPTDFFGPEIFYVDRVVRHVPGVEVVLECASPLDIQGTRLPARAMIRDICDYTYRHFTGGQFSYGSCPYNGANYFRQDGTATVNPAEDNCSHNLQGCRLRYGNFATLPIRAFPGMGRTRI